MAALWGNHGNITAKPWRHREAVPSEQNTDKESTVRRKDKEVKDTYGIREIIWECDCCRLTFPDGKSAYIVPLSFGYDEEENALYFHGATERERMDLVRQTGYAGFEVDIAHGLKTADQACGYSFRYRSVVGEGSIRVMEETQERKKGLSCIMDYTLGKDSWDYPKAMLERIAILHLDMEQMSGKEQVQEVVTKEEEYARVRTRSLLQLV